MLQSICDKVAFCEIGENRPDRRAVRKELRVTFFE
jgi:hypothetical protein